MNAFLKKSGTNQPVADVRSAHCSVRGGVLPYNPYRRSGQSSCCGPSSRCGPSESPNDIRLGSPPPETQGWTIEIAGIGKNSPPLCKRLLHSCAITTSGDLNQFIEIDGRRYSHLIDPITGIPLERRQSATVIAATAIDADAGATALCLLGMENASQQFDAMPLTEAYLMEVSKEDAAGSPPSDSSPSPTRHGVVRYRHLFPSPPTTP